MTAEQHCLTRTGASGKTLQKQVDQEAASKSKRYQRGKTHVRALRRKACVRFPLGADDRGRQNQSCDVRQGEKHSANFSEQRTFAITEAAADPVDGIEDMTLAFGEERLRD